MAEQNGTNTDCLIILYYDEDKKISTLNGLTADEKLAFTNIVQKQIDRGIEIKIRYKYLNVPAE